MEASKSKPPQRRARTATTPPSEITAISEVPPPMSTTMLPTGSWMARPAPMAAAMGCSIRKQADAPARRVASLTARRSTAVMADGTQMSTLGRFSRPTPTRCRSTLSIRSVTSKSVMAPPRSGRSATMYPGVRPIICQASVPMARTSRVRESSATTVGSLSTRPFPLA